VAHVSARPEIARAAGVPGVAARRPAALNRPETPALARRLATRLGSQWLPRAGWTISRTGRPGLIGLALLLGTMVFLVSTHLQVATEVRGLRSDLVVAQLWAGTSAPEQIVDPAPSMRALPTRADMPAILHDLYAQAARARLSVDTAKYEVSAMRSSGVIRHQIAFPVRGSYPQIRDFIDETLAAMPAVALADLLLERKSIGDATVEAQIRLNVYTRSTP
jgi:hypothetical protein